MVQEPDNNNRPTVAKLGNSNSSNRVMELNPVPLSKVMVVPRHQLVQEPDRVTELKEELALPSSNKVMVELRLEVLAELVRATVLKEVLPSSNRVTAALRPLLELDKAMAVHRTANRNQPTPTTQTAMATNLLPQLHPTSKRL
jgi:hypothetical protein